MNELAQIFQLPKAVPVKTMIAADISQHSRQFILANHAPVQLVSQRSP
jgi:hypothetical protein